LAFLTLFLFFMIRRLSRSTFFPYTTLFRSLSDGSHDFEFDVNEEFFSFFEHSLVKNAQLKVLVNLQKDPRYLSLDFDISGKVELDRKSTRLNSSHVSISYAVFCLKKNNTFD